MTNKEFIEKIASMTGLDYEEVKDVFKATAENSVSILKDKGTVHVPYLVNISIEERNSGSVKMNYVSTSATSTLKDWIKGYVSKKSYLLPK